jgi:hypothetical protein
MRRRWRRISKRGGRAKSRSAPPLLETSHSEIDGQVVLEGPDMPRFDVLCRIDAYADYVAVVEAESPEEAAEQARYNHDDYEWQHNQTQEFDARVYVTLDAEGNEIEATEVRDL